MSYYIEDDKKVIKTSRGYIFMCLGGDNNVTEHIFVGGKKKWAEVRARSWCHLNHQILEATEPEIIAFCQRVYAGDPEREVFKKGGKWVCRKDMPNYFRDGMRRAQSLETLLQANRGQVLNAYVRIYQDKDSCDATNEMQEFLHTTQELEDWLDKAKQMYRTNIADGKECYICLSFSGREPLRYGSANKGGEVVVKATSRKYNSYICDYIYGKQISFTGELEKALVFESEEDARAAIGNCWQDIKFVSYESQVKKANKPFMLLFVGGNLGGSYLRKQSSTKVYGSMGPEGAMKFGSEKEATRYAQKLRDKGWDLSRCKSFVLVNSADNSRKTLAI